MKFVKDKNFTTVEAFVPAINESALISMGANYALEVLLKADGTIDWNKISISGEVIFKKTN